LDDCTIQFEVTDNGKGIEKEHLGRLFNAFEQADNSITREYGGTGLGMALAKNIVELMGGNIRAESKVGQGSRFIFTVTLKKVKSKDGIMNMNDYIPKPVDFGALSATTKKHLSA
jgi:signal transduction histidine kinase